MARIGVSLDLSCPNCKLPKTEKIAQDYAAGVEKLRCGRCMYRFRGPNTQERLQLALQTLIAAGVPKEAAWEFAVCSWNFVRRTHLGELQNLIDKEYGGNVLS